MKRQILAALAFFLVTAQASYAGTKYQVKLSGTMVKDAASSTLYGNSAPSNPFEVSFKIDSDKAVLVPAGSTYTANLTMAHDTYKISKPDMTDFVFSLPGANFTSADLQTQVLGSVGAYDILVEGSLSAPTSINFVLANASGEFYGGIFDCPDTTCTNVLLSYTLSYADNGAGLAEADIHIGSKEDLPTVLTPLQKIENLILTLDAMTVKRNSVKVGLRSKLEYIQTQLKYPKRRAQVIRAIDSFVERVEHHLSKKGLTSEQAKILIDAALDLKSSI